MVTLSLIVICCLSWNVVTVYCSHFRGASFTWKPNNDGSITINFRISWRMSWHSDDTYCDASVISSGHLIGVPDHMTCFSGCSDTFGSVQYQCTDFSHEDDWSSGRGSITYSPPDVVSFFEFGYSGYNWIDGISGNWSFKVTADTSLRTDTGQINRSPTVDMAPIVQLQSSCNYTIHLPVCDADGDLVRCRWATGNDECGDICNGFPAVRLDNETCTLSYFGGTTSEQDYGVAIQVEDFANTTSIIPLSSVPLQFIVRVENNVNGASTCASLPEFVPPTPDDNTLYSTNAGDNFNITLFARSSISLLRIATITDVEMVRSIQQFTSDSTWHYISVDITWIPARSEAGNHYCNNLCYYATDTDSFVSAVRCVTILVVDQPKPVSVSRIGVTTTWTILFDRTFSEPTMSAILTVYEPDDNTVFMKLDAVNSTDVVFDPVNKLVYVTLNATFDIYKNYYVAIPSGLVEGEQGEPSLPADNIWRIELDCGQLHLENGEIITPNGNAFPNNATYVCDEYYLLIGEDTRTCQQNRSWSGTDPYCEAMECRCWDPCVSDRMIRTCAIITGFVGLAFIVVIVIVTFLCIRHYSREKIHPDRSDLMSSSVSLANKVYPIDMKVPHT